VGPAPLSCTHAPPRTHTLPPSRLWQAHQKCLGGLKAFGMGANSAGKGWRQLPKLRMCFLYFCACIFSIVLIKWYEVFGNGPSALFECLHTFFGDGRPAKCTGEMNLGIGAVAAPLASAAAALYCSMRGAIAASSFSAAAAARAARAVRSLEACAVAGWLSPSPQSTRCLPSCALLLRGLLHLAQDVLLLCWAGAIYPQKPPLPGTRTQVRGVSE